MLDRPSSSKLAYSLDGTCGPTPADGLVLGPCVNEESAVLRLLGRLPGRRSGGWQETDHSRRDKSSPAARMHMPKPKSRPKEISRKANKPKTNVKEREESPPLRRTLVVDVGGSGIKATVLNDLAKPVTERLRRESPASGMPGAVMDVIVALANELGEYERVAVGFPGVVINGVAMDAPNLAKEWRGFNIAESIQARLKKPVRVANDADVQGFGAIAGSGVELVVTLGTGVGTSLFVDGRLAPNLEIGNDKLRNSALQKVGKKRWNKRLVKFIKRLDETF